MSYTNSCHIPDECNEGMENTTTNTKIKSVRLHAETHAILASMCRKDQPFEDLIKKMIAVYQQQQGVKQ